MRWWIVVGTLLVTGAPVHAHPVSFVAPAVDAADAIDRELDLSDDRMALWLGGNRATQLSGVEVVALPRVDRVGLVKTGALELGFGEAFEGELRGGLGIGARSRWLAAWAVAGVSVGGVGPESPIAGFGELAARAEARGCGLTAAWSSTATAIDASQSRVELRVQLRWLVAGVQRTAFAASPDDVGSRPSAATIYYLGVGG